MKVTCKKCNKNFQYEKYNRVCPNCGRYMSMTETAKKTEAAKVEVPNGKE